MKTESPDRMAMRVKLMLAVLGAFLLLVGWYRWFSHAG
jgi:hypothetical protein